MKSMKMFKLLCCCILSTSLHAGWDSEKNLSNDTTYFDYGSSNNAWKISVWDTMVHVVWEHRNIFGGLGYLYYARSTTSGATWQPNISLSSDCHFPAVAVEANNVHVVWSIEQTGDNDVYYKRSTDNGSTWGSNKRLSFTPSTFSVYACIAVEGNNLHVVWADNQDGNYEIYYARSTDNGLNWDSPKRLTIDDSVSSYPSIAVAGNNIHIVWQDNRDDGGNIYYNRSTDNGVNWGTDKWLTAHPLISAGPSIAVRDNNLHVVWADNRDGNYEIYYGRSTNNGVNWDAEKRLTIDNASSTGPSIGIWKDTLHIAWQDTRAGQPELYYKKSTDNGLSWSLDERVTIGAEVEWGIGVAVWGCPVDVHIAWIDGRAATIDQEIYYIRHLCGPPGVEEAESFSNPFKVYSSFMKGSIIFSFYIPEEALVNLTVFDITGRVVDVVKKNMPKGDQRLVWKRGEKSTGCYFFVFELPDECSSTIKGVVF